MSRGDSRFPLDAASDEAAFGFDVGESPSGLRALVVPLGGGLCAVKVRTTDGSTRYEVCDERFQPIYVTADTLEELEARFRRKGRVIG